MKEKEKKKEKEKGKCISLKISTLYKMCFLETIVKDMH